MAQVWSLRASRTASPPGSFFHYSNLGYNILGLAVSRLAGRHATEHAAATLLAPLGMDDASARLDSATRARVATGSQPARDDIPWRPGLALAAAPWVEAEGGDGSIAASSRDMTRLMTALLNDGRIDGVQAIPQAVLARATIDLAHEGEGGVEGFGGLMIGESLYGYGINVETTGGNRCLSHGGGMIGHSSFMLVDRTAGLGVIVLTNANGCYAVGETLARHAHATSSPVKGRLPGSIWRSAPIAASMTLACAGASCRGEQRPRPEAFEIRVDNGRLMLLADGVTARLWRGWGSRMTCDHPAMERFHLSFDSATRCWSFGGRLYRSEEAADRRCCDLCARKPPPCCARRPLSQLFAVVPDLPHRAARRETLADLARWRGGARPRHGAGADRSRSLPHRRRPAPAGTAAYSRQP